MAQAIKNKAEILEKLGISTMNEMQKAAEETFISSSEMVLLSPTGSGKTLAFLLPAVESLSLEIEQVQLLIIVPSRELAIQIESVAREMGSGFKMNTVYGGTAFSKDKTNLKNPPAILIGTPGRVADHIRRNTFSLEKVETLVLDEFDKSLEIGFDKDMITIIEALPKVKKKVLTSATQGVEIPQFLGLRKPKFLDFLGQSELKLEILRIDSPNKDKLETLAKAIQNFGHEPGIIFCNYKDSIQRISDYLTANDIAHGCFYGDMEQKDRERSLIKFRNGTHQLLLATDLAARGLDIPEIKYILHYQLPIREEEFTHRNGRTARMNKEGKAYVLLWEKDGYVHFIKGIGSARLTNQNNLKPSNWATLFVSGGRGDKISKGDIAGLFMKQGKLEKDELGLIELKQDCAFVAVAKWKVTEVIERLDNSKIKSRKLRINEV